MNQSIEQVEEERETIRWPQPGSVIPPIEAAARPNNRRRPNCGYCGFTGHESAECDTPHYLCSYRHAGRCLVPHVHRASLLIRPIFWSSAPIPLTRWLARLHPFSTGTHPQSTKLFSFVAQNRTETQPCGLLPLFLYTFISHTGPNHHPHKRRKTFAISKWLSGTKPTRSDAGRASRVFHLQ